MITYLGGKSIGTFAPALARAMTLLDSFVTPALGKVGDLRAQLASPMPALPDPTLLAASLAGALAAIPAMLVAATKGQIAMRVSLAADLGAAEALVAPATDFSTRMGAVLSAGGLHAYAYQGTASAMAADVSNAIGVGLPGGGGPASPVYALVVVTESPAAFAALGEVVTTA